MTLSEISGGVIPFMDYPGVGVLQQHTNGDFSPGTDITNQGPSLSPFRSATLFPITCASRNHPAVIVSTCRLQMSHMFHGFYSSDLSCATFTSYVSLSGCNPLHHPGPLQVTYDNQQSSINRRLPDRVAEVPKVLSATNCEDLLDEGQPPGARDGRNFYDDQSVFLIVLPLWLKAVTSVHACMHIMDWLASKTRTANKT